VGSLLREITLCPAAVPALAGAILQLTLAAFLILSPGERGLRWAFALVAMCAALWSFFTAVELSTSSSKLATVAVQISLGAIACAGPVSFEFAVRLARTRSRFLRISEAMGIALALLLLLRPSLLVIEPRPSGGFWPAPSLGFLLVVLVTVPAVTLGLATLVGAARALPASRRRRQLGWGAAALAFGGMGGLDIHTVFDFGYPLGWLTCTLSCATLFYAVLQYRLMAIRAVVQRLVVVLVASLVLFVWLLALAALYQRLTPFSIAAWVLVGFVAMRLWSARVAPFLLRVFDANRRRLEGALTEFERGALDARSLDDVLERLSRTLGETLDTQLVRLIPAEEIAPLSVPLLRDLVDLDARELAVLDRFGADALVPLGPVGMAALAGGALRSADDQLAALLGRLGEAAGRAFSNAHLYEEVARRSAGLGEEVKRRTAELERALGELTAAQAKVAEAERSSSLGLLVAGVSHEINNALNFISPNLPSLARYLAEYDRVLQPSAPFVEEARQQAPAAISRLEGAVRRTSAIVEDLRKFARPDAERRLFHVTEGLDAALSLLRRRTDGRLDVTRQYAGAGLVEGYPGPLNQCFFNLLLNAVEAARGEISVAMSESEAGVKVVISDDGEGIPPGAEVFRPFFTTRPKSAGLGLTVSRAIVARHGGTLRLGVAPGGGARVEVRLPPRAPEVS
jgi:signal transduction histidine kinase